MLYESPRMPVSPHEMWFDYLFSFMYALLLSSNNQFLLIKKPIVEIVKNKLRFWKNPWCSTVIRAKNNETRESTEDQ